MIEVNDFGIVGRIVSESGFKESISFSAKENQMYNMLLSDIQNLTVFQDCKEPLPTHVTTTDVYIKDKNSNKFTYYSFHSPFKLGKTLRMKLGNAFKLMELTYNKMHNPDIVKK